MIYINEIKPHFYIPKFFGSAKGSKFELRLTNQTTKEEYAFDVYDEDDNISYYKFKVTDAMQTIEIGQYDYELSDERSNEIGALSTGILQVGSYTSNRKNYQAQKEIKTYEAE